MAVAVAIDPEIVTCSATPADHCQTAACSEVCPTFAGCLFPYWRFLQGLLQGSALVRGMSVFDWKERLSRAHNVEVVQTMAMPRLMNLFERALED